MLESPTDMDCQPARLKRTLTLPYVVLYGLGVTIGAGIYVLVGEVITRSGPHAPEGTFVVPIWVSYGGILACAALLLAGLMAG